LLAHVAHFVTGIFAKRGIQRFLLLELVDVVSWACDPCVARRLPGDNDERSVRFLQLELSATESRDWA
jgi:hypothetical protein